MNHHPDDVYKEGLSYSPFFIGGILYWRTLRIANTLPVQRHTIAYIWKMITLCGIYSCPNPQVVCVNRFPGLASSCSSAFPHIAVALSPLVSFTVIGIARKSHPNSLGIKPAQSAQIHMLFIKSWAYAQISYGLQYTSLNNQSQILVSVFNK